MTISTIEIKNIIEAAIFTADEPLSLDKIVQLFSLPELSKNEILKALESLQIDYENKAIELKQVASGFRFQVKQDYASWIAKLWDEKPARYSRAFLETLVLIAYRQPITRGEIEAIRGVAVSSHIIKSILDRQWIRIVGHKDIPGKPALFATTKQFLDYFNLKNLEDLPTLSQLKNLEEIEFKLGNQLEINLTSPLLDESIEEDFSSVSIGKEDRLEEEAYSVESEA